MTKLSDAQIAAAARAGGFPAGQIATAVAVALAESGGETTASHVNKDGTIDRGLWQINSVHTGGVFEQDHFDPIANAHMAYAVYQSQGWSGWTTHTNGQFVAFMPRGIAAARTHESLAGMPEYLAHRVRPTEWRSYQGHRIPPPPPGTFKAAPLLSAKTAKQQNVDASHSGWVPTKFSSAHDAAVWKWLKQFLDTDTPQGWKTQPQHSTIYNLYYQALHDYRHAGSSPGGGLADPGKAEAGLGPLPNPLSALEALISFITNSHNWLRIAYFLAGGALILLAASKLAKGVKS